MKKGLDVRVDGSPKQVIRSANGVRRVALLGRDYAGLKPRMQVEVGQAVGLGEPLFIDKRDPDVIYPSPGSGRVIEINRGRRRVLQSVVVALDDSAATEQVFDVSSRCDAGAIRELLCRSGAWTGFRSRPYDRVPLSTSSPQSIFVTAVDTRPLAPAPCAVIAARRREFEVGMLILSRLGDWPVYLCTDVDWQGYGVDEKHIRHVEFAGPHPAGLPGTHIHHLAPVTAGQSAWHIGYQDVIAIGYLFTTGRLLTERVVSLAGSGVANPALLKTRVGAATGGLVDGELRHDGQGGGFSVFSGSVLDGASTDGPHGYLGRYHNQVSVLSQPHSPWQRQRPTGIVARALTALRSNAWLPSGDTMPMPMIPIGAFDRVMPLDILPVPLLRALLVKDTDTAQALGCLDLAEEDLALCSFVCPAKQNYGAVLRANLEQIEAEG